MTVDSGLISVPTGRTAQYKPPKASGFPLVGVLPHMRRDPINFLTKIATELGDVVRLDLGFDRALLFSAPEDIKHIFQDNRLNYHKSRYMITDLKPVIGNGMLLAEDDLWQHQRQIAIKGFEGRRLKAMGDHMTSAAMDMSARWRARAHPEAPINMVQEAMRLTLDVVLRSMFSVKLEGVHGPLYDAITFLLRDIERRFWMLIQPPAWLPVPMNIKRTAMIRILYAFIDDVLAQRRQMTNPPDDLFQMLIDAYGDKNEALLRNEALTFIIAGQDTTASALVWTWAMLSRHAHAWHQMKNEVDRVLEKRIPCFEDIQDLPITSRILQETLRLFPPAWTLSRTAVKDDKIGNTFVAAGTTVIVAPWVVHHRADLWPNPEGFDPDRFTPAATASRHRFAYIPFGGGPRVCIGARFATMEATLVLAKLAQEWRLDLAPGYRLDPEPMLIQRPRNGLWMVTQPL
ncbi:MAG: cytochrome P450 [Alphaproteobacteria bacterium]